MQPQCHHKQLDARHADANRRSHQPGTLSAGNGTANCRINGGGLIFDFGEFPCEFTGKLSGTDQLEAAAEDKTTVSSEHRPAAR